MVVLLHKPHGIHVFVHFNMYNDNPRFRLLRQAISRSSCM